MADSEARAPIDQTVAVPPSVKRAADAADAIHKQLYGDSEPPVTPTPPGAPDALIQIAESPPLQPDIPTPEPVAQPAPPVPEPPRPPARDVPETGEPGSWEHRYQAMKGRFDQSQQTIGSMQQQMQEMGDEIMRWQAVHNQRGAQEQTPRQGRKTLTDEDVNIYGNELIDFVKRAAVEAVSPDLAVVQGQTRQVSQRVAQSAQQTFYNDLSSRVPEWRDLNSNERFKEWCRLPDVYSGEVRGKLLNNAVRAGNTPRAVAFFKGFLNEERATGQMPAPQPQPQETAPRQAAVSLESLAAPGRPKPAGGNTSVAADKPVFTRSQISGFYSDVRKGAYNGREADKTRTEAAIFAAQNEGRIR